MPARNPARSPALRLARVARLALAGAALASLATGATARAQTGGEGVFLLLPVGARAVGMAGAVAGARGGSDLLFWNAAGIAGDSTHEAAIHHSQTTVGQGNALALVWPLGRQARFGSIGTSINVLDFGEQTATAEDGSPIGTIVPTDYGYGLTYAVAATPFLALGATLRHVELRIACTGQCAGLATGGSSSNGGDLGAQIRLPTMPLTVGLAARNLWIGRGNTRPARLDLGGDYRVLAVERVAPRVQLHAAAGIVTTTALDSASFRVGSDVVLDERIHVRAGYIRDPANGSGGAVGIGLSAGKLAFDIARTFGGLVADTNVPPTYFSLRYVW